MKLLLLLFLFPVLFNSNPDKDSISEKQILLIHNFLDDLNNNSTTIETYLKYIGPVDYEGYNLDIQCSKMHLSKDSCLIFQKSYCDHPKNISYTLKRLREHYFLNTKIDEITVEKVGDCSIYKVFLDCQGSETDCSGGQNNKKMFYIIILKRGRNPDYIYNIMDSCMNSIMVG